MVWLVLKMSGWKANLLATIVIVIDILVLAYFKYFGFFVQEIIGLFVSLPPNWKELSPIPVPSQIPPGVSFYTFQMVAFVVDSLREKKKKPLAVLDYVNFISFFPQIVAGPIERRRDLLPQMEGFRLKFTGENFEKGLRWLSLGVPIKTGPLFTYLSPLRFQVSGTVRPGISSFGGLTTGHYYYYCVI